MPFTTRFSKCVVLIAMAIADAVPASTKPVTNVRPVQAKLVSTKPAIVASTGHKYPPDPDTGSHLLRGQLNSEMHHVCSLSLLMLLPQALLSVVPLLLEVPLLLLLALLLRVDVQ